MAKNLTSTETKHPRPAVAFFHIVNDKGTAMGWLGYCETINEAMIPAMLHPDGATGAETRARFDPPQVIATHHGAAYVPYSWICRALQTTRDIFVVEQMKITAENCMNETRGVMSEPLGRSSTSVQSEI